MENYFPAGWQTKFTVAVACPGDGLGSMSEQCGGDLGAVEQSCAGQHRPSAAAFRWNRHGRQRRARRGRIWECLVQADAGRQWQLSQRYLVRARADELPAAILFLPGIARWPGARGWRRIRQW